MEKKGDIWTYPWPASEPCLWTSWCRLFRRGVGLFEYVFFFFLDPFSSFLFFFLLCPSLLSLILNPDSLSLQHCQFGHLRTCAQPPLLKLAGAAKKVCTDLSHSLLLILSDGNRCEIPLFCVRSSKITERESKPSATPGSTSKPKTLIIMERSGGSSTLDFHPFQLKRINHCSGKLTRCKKSVLLKFYTF